MGSERHPHACGRPPAVPLPGIDIDDVMLRLEGNFPLLARLLPQFVGTCIERSTLLRQAWRARDVGKIAVLLHQLRGAAGSTGATDILSLVRRAEEDLARGGVPVLRLFLDDLDRAIADVGRATGLALDALDAAPPVLYRPPAVSQFVMLLDLLKNDNMRALEVIWDCETYLASSLGRAQADHVISVIENLDFAKARSLLTEPAAAQVA